jgi:hypothetical protein
MSKKCRSCKETKSLNDFNKDKTRAGGRDNQCRECKKNRDKEYRNTHFRIRGYRNKKHDWRKKGIKCYTIQHYQQDIKKQDNKCAICKEIMDPACVDHDHDTGMVRKLLCRTCNAGIGLLKDNADLLREAADYLDSFKDIKAFILNEE